MNIDEQFDEVYNQTCGIIDSYYTLIPREYTAGVWSSIVDEYKYACKVKAVLDKVLEQHNADAI